LPIGRRPVIKNKISPVIDHEIQKKMVAACSNTRDKMLILLLLETGMRIGQALQLRHDDIESWNGRIKMQYRTDNLNDTYAKTKKDYYVHVSNAWLDIYTNALIRNDTDADYIFTKLYRKDGGDVAEPLRYSAVKDLFIRISSKLQVKITPHMLRHTHATELLRSGVPMEMVSKRLGHSSIETTKQAYEHLSAEDIKLVILEGHDRIDKKRKEYAVERITNIES
jgi:integrase/recombinase XerD